MRRDYQPTIEQLVRGYERGIYTAVEVLYAAVHLMTPETAGEVAAKLPPDIANRLREIVSGATTWPDEVWQSLISIGGPEPTPESRALCRAKYTALDLFFSGQGRT